MGRKFNVSQPTVINTELRQLDESFYISADGQTEQWYYDNTAQYAPNRVLTPLTLSPMLSLFDGDTKTTYNNPSFNQIKWYALEYDESNEDYIETQITNITDSSEASYVIVGNTLKVKKNTPYTRSITIRCLAEYIDPRDSGITNTVQETILLTTNRDAQVVFPEVAIISPSGRSFNPLTDYKEVNGVQVQDSEFVFDGVITNSPDVEQSEATRIVEYPVDGGGTEELVEEDGVMTALPSMDIRYPDGDVMLDQSFLYRVTANGTKPNVDGMAFLTALRGNTVKWNQLMPENKRSASKSYTANAVYYELIITGLSVTITKSHKYYERAYVTRNISENNGINFLFNNELNFVTVSNGSSDGLKSAIVNATSSFVATTIRASNYYYKRGFSAGDSFSISNITSIDLTAMFGTDAQIASALGITTDDITTETGVAAFETWLETNLGKRDYYPYDAGSLVPTQFEAVKTTGRNVFDGVVGVNSNYLESGGTYSGSVNWIISDYLHIFPNTGYYFLNVATGTNPSICWYDKNKQFISGKSGGSGSTNVNRKVLTSPDNAYYLRISVNKSLLDTACVNISNPLTDGTFHPYSNNITPLEITSITGKLNGEGESVTVFPDGMKRHGNVYDEIKIENGVLKAIKRLKGVDMGTLSYGSSGSSFTWPSNVPKVNTSRINNVVIPFYTPNSVNYASMPDMTYGGSGGANTVCFLRDARYNSAEEMKAAMSGIIAYFVLQTPEEYVLDPIQSPFLFEWFGISNNEEVKADTLPWYVSGQSTSHLKVDAMFGENINVVLRAKMPNGELSPSKAHAAVAWRIPDVDTHVVCQNGSAVRSDTLSMTFKTICNVNGKNLDDSVKNTHMRFNWKTRKNTVTTETDKGWGTTKTIVATDLRNTIGATSSLASTLVYPYVYVLGAWKVKTSTTVVDYDKPEMTKNGVTYERTID